jgi:hypothetical protein
MAESQTAALTQINELVGFLFWRLSKCPHTRRLKQWPDIGAAVAEDLASKLRLQVGQADVVAPAIGIHDDKVSAFIVAAKDL